jgi:hypothetical protein
MNRSTVVMLVLVFAVASCIIVTRRAFSSVDAVEDSWVSKASMQYARGGLGVVAVNGKIYAIGGSNASGSYPPDVFTGGFVGTNEMYDPETGMWATKATMPTPRCHFAIAAYQNKIYCIGGAVGFNVDEIGFHSSVVSGVNEVYDTVTDTWKTKTPMPDEGRVMQAHVVNGKIYVVNWSVVYIYDPEEDSWTATTRMPEPYPKWDSWPVSAVVDGKIVVTFEYYPAWGSPEQRVVVYDVETDSWSEGTSGRTAVVQGAAAAVAGVKAPQKVYVLGLISDASRITMTNQVYDLETDTWATATSMSTIRSSYGIAIMKDTLYVIGGYLRGSYNVEPVAVNEQYLRVGYGVSPEIKVVSPVNQTYDVSNVLLVFAVNKTVNWIGYSLDGQDNVTVGGNTTLADLPNGLHSVTVYAEDAFGNMGASETISFTVEVPFPVALVAAVSVAFVVIASAGLLVYLKRCRR